MSRIDTAKLHSGSSSGISPSRMARALSRDASVPVPGDLAQRAFVAPAFPRPEQGFEQEDTTPPAIGAVSEIDLEPVTGMGGERLLGELCRIEILLKDQFGSTSDPELQASLDAGLSMIGETVRRLRLVHGGHDALVLKR